MAKIYSFRGRGFHISVEWKIGFKIINKQTIAQILIVNTVFYMYGNIGLKEIKYLELVWTNTRKNYIRLGFFGSARQLGRGFHTWPIWIRKNSKII